MARSLLIQGHRGAAGLRPENTLASFEAALRAGARSIETDVHLTADSTPVLSHDPLLPGENRLISAATEAEATATGLVTLRDLYRFVVTWEQEFRNRPDTIIDVDIKSMPFRPEFEPAAVERAVVDVVRSENAVARTWVRGFDHRVVRRLRQIEPGLTGVALLEGAAPVDPVGLTRAALASVFAPEYRFLDEEEVRQCHAAGIHVLPWTVNDPDDWERLISWGVDGITTDFPDRLAAFLSRQS